MKKIKILFSSLLVTIIFSMFLLPSISKVNAARETEMTINFFEFNTNNNIIEKFSSSENVDVVITPLFPNFMLEVNTLTETIYTGNAGGNDPNGVQGLITFNFDNPIVAHGVGTSYDSKDFDQVTSISYDPKTPDQYKVNSTTYTISGWAGENFQATFIMEAKDNKRPVISGQENFVTNVDDERPLSYFKNFLSAYDETDGDVTDRIWVETDNYTDNIRVLGAHEVVFGVDDLSGNDTYVTVYIRVVDITPPIITGSTKTEEISYTKTYDLNSFKTTLSVSDNVDNLSHSDITIKTDNYTSNKTKLGTYTVIYSVKDGSGNEGTFEKKIKVIDDVDPTFSGPTTIATSNNTILTESDVRAQIKAHDDIDGTLTSKIKLVSDNFTGKGNKVGNYTIVYEVYDNAGNKATHTVTIQRLDKIPPIIWIEDGVTIKTTPTTPLTFEQIIDILQATGQINITSETSFRLKDDTYTGNESTPGIYMMTIEAKSTNGNESKHNLTITVLADDDDNGVNVSPDFNVKEFFKDNWVYITIGSVILIAGGYYFFKKKK